MTSTSWNRRDWLGSLGSMAAANVALTQSLVAADNPAAAVADRTSTIRITKLTATPMQRKVFLKMETNHGVTGWGEIDQLEPYVAAALARSLFELLDNENPTRIEYLWQKIYRSHRDMRGGPFMTHTLAGIDMALWDIAGKLWGVPVHRLMGGPTRDKVRVYPSTTATKVGAGPEEFSGTPADIERHVQSIAGARKQVGPDGLVMFDAHCALPPPFLIQLAGAIQPFDVTYIEEPAVPGNIEVFKRIKQHVKIPLAIGERTWIWLNGKPVVDGAVMENYWERTKPLPAKGPIMLQTHGGEIRWRNIFVREIGEAEAKKILADAAASKKP